MHALDDLLSCINLNFFLNLQFSALRFQLTMLEFAVRTNF